MPESSPEHQCGQDHEHRPAERESENAILPAPADLHASLDDSLLVRHVAVPLESCGINDDAKAVRGYLEGMNLDVLGLTENGVVQGYIRRQELRTGASKGFKDMERLRDKLAHGKDLVAGSGWDDVLKVAAELEAFLRQCDEKRGEFVKTFDKGPG